MKYELAIFDMDGTVLDTIEDLAGALNYAMEKAGHKHDFTVAEVRQFFGSGAQVAFERALEYEGRAGDTGRRGTEAAKPSDEAGQLVEIFSAYYPDHCEELTRPFPQIEETLEALRSDGMKLAIVSNKIDPAVQVLARNYFPGCFDFAIGTGADLRRKPYPDMVTKCLETMGIRREDAVYIGDSEVDLKTAANAGLLCISVAWGFRDEEYLKAHGAEKIVRTPAELMAVLKQEK